MEFKQTCLPPTTLSLYLQGRLPTVEAETVERHVCVCRSCLEALEQLEKVDPVLGALQATPLATTPDLDLVEFKRQVKALGKQATQQPLAVPGYEVLKELGRGGMGVVYLARDVQLGRLVAVKMILKGVHATSADVARLRAEAEALARLSHPNIVRIYEIGEHNGLPYVVLEYCEGGTLQAHLQAKPLPPRDAARLVQTLALAVAAAHQRQIVHRDLKPANVLLTEQGDVRITDFGLARCLDVPFGGQTPSGAILGTPSYMAPEQARGQSGLTGTLIDVYALGAVLYELTTGRPPFRGLNNAQTLLDVLTNDPIPPRQLEPRLPLDLDTICLKCLEKNPARRYASANDLARDLERFLKDEPIRARLSSPLERLLKWGKRRPVWAALLAVCTVAALSLVGLSIWLARVAGELQETVHQRDRALSAAREARLRSDQHLYGTDLRLFSQLWRAGDVRNLGPLLGRHRPQTAPDVDRRGFEWYFSQHLSESLGGEQLQGSDEETFCLAFSPDGVTLATAGKGGKVQLWNTSTWQVRQVLQGHPTPVRWLTFLTKGHTLATSGDDQTLRLWDLSRGVQIREWTRKGARRLLLSTDGDWLLAHLADYTFQVVRAETGTVVLETPPGREVPVGCLTVAAQGQLCSAAVAPTLLHFRNLRTGGHVDFPLEEGIELVSCDPDGWFCALGSRQGTVAVLHIGVGPVDWRLPDLGYGVPNARGIDSYQEPVGSVRCLALGPDRETVASGTDHGLIRLRNFRRRENRQLLRGHTDRIWAMTFSPDGQTLVSASADGTLRRWQLTSAVEKLSLTGRLQPTGALTLSGDGKWLALGGHAGRVGLVAVATGRLVGIWSAHGAEVRSLAFSPDGQTLFTAGLDRQVKRWSVPHGRELAHWSVEGIPSSLAVAPSCRWVAVGFHSHPVIQRWNMDTGEALAVQTTESVIDLAVAPDGKVVVAASADGTVRAWDAATWQSRFTLRLGSKPLRLAFSPTGELLALLVAGRERLVVANAATGQILPSVAKDVGTPVELTFVGARSLALSDPFLGLRLVDLQDGGVRQRWDYQGTHQESQPRRPFHALRLACTPDGRSLVSYDESSNVHLWNLFTWEVCKPPQQLAPVRAVAFTPDGKTLIAAASRQPVVVFSYFRALLGGEPWNNQRLIPEPDQLRLWDTSTGEELEPLPDQRLTRATSLTLTAQGRKVLVGSQGGLIGRWDVETRAAEPSLFTSPEERAYWRSLEVAQAALKGARLLAIKPEFRRTVVALTASRDGRHLAAACDDGTVQLWDATALTVRLTLNRKHDQVAGLAFTPDAATLAVNDGAEVRLWDVTTGAELHRLAGHREPIRCLAIAPDGKRLATGSSDQRIHLWNLSSPHKQELVGHTDRVAALAFSPDGRTLASGGWDGTVRLWQVETGQEVAVLEGHRGRVTAVAFSPHGRRLASGAETPGGNGELYLWKAGN